MRATIKSFLFVILKNKSDQQNTSHPMISNEYVTEGQTA